MNVDICDIVAASFPTLQARNPKTTKEQIYLLDKSSLVWIGTRLRSIGGGRHTNVPSRPNIKKLSLTENRTWVLHLTRAP